MASVLLSQTHCQDVLTCLLARRARHRAWAVGLHRRLDGDVSDIHRDERGLRQGRAVRLASDRPPEGGEADPAEDLVVIGVVRDWRVAYDVDAVIVSAQDAIGAKVEDLIGIVRCDAGRKQRSRASPGFVVFSPRLQLFDLETRPGEREGYGEGGPQCAAKEIRQSNGARRDLQIVALERQTGDRSVRL